MSPMMTISNAKMSSRNLLLKANSNNKAMMILPKKWKMRVKIKRNKVKGSQPINPFNKKPLSSNKWSRMSKKDHRRMSSPILSNRVKIKTPKSPNRLNLSLILRKRIKAPMKKSPRKLLKGIRKKATSRTIRKSLKGNPVTNRMIKKIIVKRVPTTTTKRPVRLKKWFLSFNRIMTLMRSRPMTKRTRNKITRRMSRKKIKRRRTRNPNRMTRTQNRVLKIKRKVARQLNRKSKKTINRTLQLTTRSPKKILKSKASPKKRPNLTPMIWTKSKAKKTPRKVKCKRRKTIRLIPKNKKRNIRRTKRSRRQLNKLPLNPKSKRLSSNSRPNKKLRLRVNSKL